ncbi:hypothetical protein FA127_29200 [Pseudomonas aeruginosa]|nr:hypothetical protein [Pseudomonas aeruginosa]
MSAPSARLSSFSNSLLQSISPQAIRGTVTHRRVRPEACREPHSGASMIKKGVFPIGTSRAEVEKAVIGTFGGRFEYFNEEKGQFKYIAYTD